MRVVYYTRSGYLDSALPVLAALSNEHDVHLVVEVSPEGRVGPMGSLPLAESPGLHPSDLSWLPAPIAARLRALASCQLAAFPHPRAFHPSNLVTCRAVARLVRSVRPDVLHFDDATTRGVGTIYMTRRPPLVLSIHDSHPRVGERKGRFELVRARFLAHSKLVVFRSRYARDSFLDRVPLRRGTAALVVPLGTFDLFAELCAPADADPSTVLFFGRLAPYKGIEVLRAAAPAIAERASGVRFVLAGAPVAGFDAGPPPDLPSGATWDAGGGHVGLEDLCRLFHSATVVVLPYVEASQSGVVSTAFAFGKPVVASAVGGIPEVVEDGVTGRLVPPEDPVALAAAVGDLLDDPAARAAIGRNIAERAEGSLSPGCIAENVAAAYRDVATQSG